MQAIFLLFFCACAYPVRLLNSAWPLRLYRRPVPHPRQQRQHAFDEGTPLLVAVPHAHKHRHVVVGAVIIIIVHLAVRDVDVELAVVALRVVVERQRLRLLVVPVAAAQHVGGARRRRTLLRRSLYLRLLRRLLLRLLLGPLFHRQHRGYLVVERQDNHVGAASGSVGEISLSGKVRWSVCRLV